MEHSHKNEIMRSQNGTLDDPFNTLRAFNAVVEYGSISSAARVLDWPKSTLSRRLHSLERQLGQVLMHRSSDGMTLTEAGRCYCEYCQKILALAAEAQRAVNASAESLAGLIRIRISHDLNWGWITKTLNQFLAKNPAVTLDIQYIRPTHNIEEEDIDLWVWSGGEPETRFHYVPLGTWKRRVYAAVPPNGKMLKLESPNELVNFPWIEMAGDSNQRLLNSQHQGFSLNALTPRFRVENLHMLADSIARGYGLGILPTWYARCQIHGKPGLFQPVLEDWAASPIPLGLLHPPGPMPQRVYYLLKSLKETVPVNWKKMHI